MNGATSADAAILPSTTSPACPDPDVIGEGKAWGVSTAVDLQDCDPDTIRDRDRIEAYVVALCELIGMRRFGPCQVVHFGEGRVAGYSMVQLIETSLISGHFANDTNRAYLDIFSCKGYDVGVVEEFSRRFFGARRSTTSVTVRY
jgi:S-adenosylmethionine/arginine decarboxylase-like enzyme